MPSETSETPLQAAQRRLIAIVGLDTNVLRSAGLDLGQAWFAKLLNACDDLNAEVIVPSIAFEEWFKFHKDRLSQIRSKAQAALRDLASFDMPERVADVVAEPSDEVTRARLVAMLGERGISVVPNSPCPMEQYLQEAVCKEPPFENGGKGFVDAVIIDSIVAHAAANASGSHVLLVSEDAAVSKSIARFTRKGLYATITSKDGAYDAIVNSQDAETRKFVRDRDAALLEHVRKFEEAIVAAAHERPYSLTALNPFKSKVLTSESPTHVVGLRPKFVDSVTVYQGIPELIAGTNRYRVSVAVKCDIDLVFKSYFDLSSFFRIGESNQTASTVGRDSPLPIPTGSMLTAPREWEETHETTISVHGSINRTEYDQGIATGFRLEPELTEEQRVQMSEYREGQKTE